MIWKITIQKKSHSYDGSLCVSENAQIESLSQIFALPGGIKILTKPNDENMRKIKKNITEKTASNTTQQIFSRVYLCRTVYVEWRMLLYHKPLNFSYRTFSQLITQINNVADGTPNKHALTYAIFRVHIRFSRFAIAWDV